MVVGDVSASPTGYHTFYRDQRTGWIVMVMGTPSVSVDRERYFCPTTRVWRARAVYLACVMCSAACAGDNRPPVMFARGRDPYEAMAKLAHEARQRVASILRPAQRPRRKAGVA